MTWLKPIALVALVLGAGVAIYLFPDINAPYQRSDTEPVTETSPDPAETDAERQASATHSTADAESEASPDPAIQPAFDVVRVERTGEVVVAGVAPPGWTVRVQTRDIIIGEVKSGPDGAWVLLPDKPLPPGDHSISLIALGPEGTRRRVSSERVAVSVSEEREPAVVALSDEDKPTRVLQSGREERAGSSADQPTPDDKAAARPATISFSAVDYKDAVSTGRLSMSGDAEPGARIALYLDNRFIGSAQADDEGAWQFSITDVLESGVHQLRADHVDMERGKVLSRAEVRFDHSGLKIAGTPGGETRTAHSAAGDDEVSGKAPPGREDKAAVSDRGAGDATAQAGRDDGPESETRGSSSEEARKEAIIVRRGDTLWHIAEQYYGSGVRYTKIFRGNQDQIRNPNRIYPGQRFDLPD